MMTRNFRIVIAALVISAMFPAAYPARAQSPNDPNWIKVAEARPGHDPEHDVFELDPHAGRFAKVRFRVRGPSVHFMHIRVTFGNDEAQDIGIDKTVDDNQGTGALDLLGAPREVKRVEATYATVGHRGSQGFVTLWGYH